MDFACEELARVQNPALIVAHPGHELYVLGWVKRARPRVFVLTDGSGHTGQSRAGSTARLLHRLDAPKGEVFCPLTDRAIYGAILSGDVTLFHELLETIAGALIAHDIDFVAGDAIEGFNPSHDICRFLIDGAAALVGRRTGRALPNCEIRLTTWENGAPARHGPECLHLELSPLELQEKLEAAASYQGLQGEVGEHLAAQGAEHFRVECFKRLTFRSHAHPTEPPHYDKVGAQRVREGVYQTALRYRDHVRPIYEAIGAYASTR